MHRHPPHAWIFALASSLLAVAPRPQIPGEPISIGVRRTLHSKLLGEERTLLISTPRSYPSGEEAYPVLFLLDGSAHFHHTAASVHFLATHRRIPEMLVVGIENTDRTRDLTPTNNNATADMPTAGGADVFLRFIQEELTPWLGASYRTRSLRVLIGHSFGGLFAVHALSKAPGFFGGIIAISPSMQWDDQELVARTSTWLDSRPDVSGSLYLTVGNEGVGLLGGTLKLSGLLSEKCPPGLRWKFRHMPAETHGSVPHRSTYDGLEFLFADWWLQDPVATYDAGGWQAVHDHFARTRPAFGFAPDAPPNAVIGVLNGLVSARRLDDAVAAATTTPPEWPIPGGYWNFLAGQFEEGGDAEAAKRCYLACLDAQPQNAQARRRLSEMGTRLPDLLKAVAVPRDILERYVGEFRLTAMPSVKFAFIIEDDQLRCRLMGREAEALHAESESVFAAPRIDASIEFHIDADGAVTKATLRRWGQEIPCERVP